MRKRMIPAICAMLVILTAFPAYAGTWTKDSAGWKYQQDDGSNLIATWQRIVDSDGTLRWYYFDITGHAQSGWKDIGGQRYFFFETNYEGEESSMATGWLTKRDSGDYFFLNDGRFYDLPEGAMVRDGWREIDGKECYFGKAGAILMDANTPDGYYVNLNGEKDGAARKRADSYGSDDNNSYWYSSNSSNSSEINYDDYDDETAQAMRALVRNAGASFSNKKSVLLKFISECGYRQSRFTITTRGIEYTGNPEEDDVDQRMLDRMQNYMDGVNGAAVALIQYLIG
ncbi:hypothetical protein [Brotaphodocola sp.]|uniref:hypothetical protein n=1 Tax=Brotaphodocola sp. TaxID=3073577 RepID=UPI003D7ECCDF